MGCECDFTLRIWDELTIEASYKRDHKSCFLSGIVMDSHGLSDSLSKEQKDKQVYIQS